MTAQPNPPTLPSFDELKQDRRPYYIASPEYQRTSAGVRAMFQLCHYLNRLGEEAYMTTEAGAPGLHTPLLTDDIRAAHRTAGRAPIAIYPEVVVGNPQEAPSVVRYILNHPGLIGGLAHFPASDSVFFYNPEYARSLPHLPRQLLQMPLVDTRIFHPPKDGESVLRSDILVYPGRHTEALNEHRELFERGVAITYSWPDNHEALADLLRRGERLYSFSNSAVVQEAILCGCPVVLMPSPYTEKFLQQFKDNPNIGRPPGIALDDSAEEIARATGSVARFQEMHAATEASFVQQLVDFIAISQALPLVSPDTAADTAQSTAATAEASQDSASDDSPLPPFGLARNDRQSLLAALAGLAHPPAVHVILFQGQASPSHLLNSLASLQAQDHPGFTVAVISTSPGFEPAWERITRHVFEPSPWQFDPIDLGARPDSWCVFLSGGQLLADNALTQLAVGIATHPEWQLVCSDEDLVDRQGCHARPIHNFAFDADFLRSGAMFPGLVASPAHIWQQAGGWRALPAGQDELDALLRLSEHVPVPHIGHLPAILLHRPHPPLPSELSEAQVRELRQLVLREHLGRIGFSGDIAPGLQDNQLRLLHPLPVIPKVTLAVLSKDNGEQLEACLASLTEKTRYPNLELLVVDNGSVEPASCALLQQLAAMPGNFVRILPYDAPFNLAAMCNLAVSAAQGELVVLLHDDVQALHADWLEELASQCLRPGIGMAGARLLAPDGRIQEAGIVPLQAGLTANAMSRHLADMPDRLGRLHTVHAVSAISAACMMVRRELYLALGGMNPTQFPRSLADIDFCLKLRQAGHGIVWTPYATLLHDSNGSSAGAPRDNNTLLAQWGRFLVDDPNFHPGLAIDGTDYRPEKDPALQPDPLPASGLPNLFAVAREGSHPDRLRVTGPIRAATEAGLVRGRIGSFLPVPVVLSRLDSRIVYCPPPQDEHELAQLRSYRRLLGCRIIVHLDDALSDSADPAHDITELIGRLAPHVDRFVTASPFLAALVAPRTQALTILPETLPDEIWNTLVSQRRDGGKPRVGWYGQREDLETIAATIVELTPEVDWIFVVKPPEILAPCMHEFHPIRSLEDLPTCFASLDLDLAILPLAGTLRNHCQGEATALMFGMLGVPVIASDTGAFATDLPITRVASQLNRDWTVAIRQHLADRAACRAAGDRLRQHVRTQRLLSQQLDLWLATLTGTP